MTPATLLSALAHVVAIVVLWHVLRLPSPFTAFVQREVARAAERLSYVRVARDVAPRPAARPSPSAPQAPVAPRPLVAPREIPRGLPAPAAARPVDLGPASGPVIGGRGIVRGVQPAYVDPRVWSETPRLEPAPKSDEQRLDSAVAARVGAHNDSLAAHRYEPNKFERGDWTVEKDGKKYGIDQQYIRLGRFSIPTALLALLPMNAAPSAASRELQNPAVALHRGEIPYQAARAVTHEEFRRAVKQLRERKERERREREEKARRPVASSEGR
ncbi:MAG: hypothetical protein ACT4R6_04460 [Gemmatimonadaceae bacterium]